MTKGMIINRAIEMTRREFHRLAFCGAASLLATANYPAVPVEPGFFVHPGILHTNADLERMRRGARRKHSPIAAGFERFSADFFSQGDYKPHAFVAEVGRNPSVNSLAFDDDCNAAYQCSLMAAITGEANYARVARSILLGWAGSLQTVSGAARCAAMLRRGILPAIIDFAPFANGNWDTAAVKTMLAIAVFCDDRSLFKRALLYYLHGDGDGRLTHYIYENGQCQESGRDQQHTQLGLAHMGDACQIAWNQGLDLYGAVQDRLLRGFEYTAGYNLGDRVEFHPDIDRTGKYRHQKISPPSTLRPIYEQIFAHYHVQLGLPTPAVERAVAELRPEGAAHGADHTGFGTLLYALNPSDVDRRPISALPAALHACAEQQGIELEWLKPCREESISVERATGDHPFERIASGITDTVYLDTSVQAGARYKYRVRMRTAELFSADANVVEVVNGIPRGWTHYVLGDPANSGTVSFDGEVITLFASGGGIVEAPEEGQFLCAPLATGSLTIRCLPGTASQYAQFGLSCRGSISANASFIALVVLPVRGSRELAGWMVRFFARDRQGKVTVISECALRQPTVCYGRLMGPVWLRLQRVHASHVAHYSTNGKAWNQMGSNAEFADGRMGIVASSGISGVDTAVRFDSIEINDASVANASS